jgi:hypothetical protein
MNDGITRVPGVAFTDVMDCMFGSMFFDEPMSEEAALRAESSLSDWHQKVTMMEMATGIALMKNTARLIGALYLIEDGMCDPEYIAAIKVSNPELFVKLHKEVLDAILARPKYMKEIWAKVSVNPAAVAQGVQKHFHVHISTSLADVEGFPKELIQNEMVRRRSVMMYDTLMKRVDTRTGVSKIPPPKVRSPRVFQPTDEQRKTSPKPLTKEEME